MPCSKAARNIQSSADNRACAHTHEHSYACTESPHFRITALNLHGNSPLRRRNAELMGERQRKEEGMREKRKQREEEREEVQGEESTRQEGKKMLQGDTQGARQRPRDRRWEGSGLEGDKIKNGCLFIHNFLFIQNARLPSGSHCYVSE